MDKDDAVRALGALAHPGRLEVFRLLVQAGSDGMAAGEIARATGSPPSSLSANLTILSNAGLIASRRDGRLIIYRAAYDQMTGLLAFLMEDCCAGAPAVCAPLVAIAGRACAAEGKAC